jgi:hypothetical protein
LQDIIADGEKVETSLFCWMALISGVNVRSLVVKTVAIASHSRTGTPLVGSTSHYCCEWPNYTGSKLAAAILLFDLAYMDRQSQAA